jgi:hypothetical protein
MQHDVVRMGHEVGIWKLGKTCKGEIPRKKI